MLKIKFELQREISINVPLWYALPAKSSDQTAHMRSLIRAFAFRLNILSLLGY